jgi:hypothetical protein
MPTVQTETLGQIPHRFGSPTSQHACVGAYTTGRQVEEYRQRGTPRSRRSRDRKLAVAEKEAAARLEPPVLS